MVTKRLGAALFLQDKDGNRYFSNKDGVTITVIKDCNINVQNNARIKTGGNCDIEASGDCNIDASGNATITSPNVKITGGQLTVSGSVTPGTGPFSCLPNCAFTGVPHTGNMVSGT